MAQRGRQYELFGMALSCLRCCGYTVSDPASSHRFGRNVRSLSKGGVSETVLIQTRSHQAETSRYLVGIVVADLERVDSVVLWFEGEDIFLRIPSRFLRHIHEQMNQEGLARYTGQDDQQWRVDIHLNDQELSPQGSDGRRYSLTEYVCYAEPAGQT